MTRIGVLFGFEERIHLREPFLHSPLHGPEAILEALRRIVRGLNGAQSIHGSNTSREAAQKLPGIGPYCCGSIAFVWSAVHIFGRFFYCLYRFAPPVSTLISGNFAILTEIKDTF